MRFGGGGYEEWPHSPLRAGETCTASHWLQHGDRGEGKEGDLKRERVKLKSEDEEQEEEKNELKVDGG